MTVRAHPWLAALQSLHPPRVVGMLFLGFSAGLPLLLVLGTLSFWLSEAGHRARNHRALELGGTGLRLQVPVVAAGGPAAAALPDGGWVSGGRGCCCRRSALPLRSWEWRTPTGAEPDAYGVLCAGGGVLPRRRRTSRSMPIELKRWKSKSRGRWPRPIRRATHRDDHGRCGPLWMRRASNPSRPPTTTAPGKWRTRVMATLMGVGIAHTLNHPRTGKKIYPQPRARGAYAGTVRRGGPVRAGCFTATAWFLQRGAVASSVDFNPALQMAKALPDAGADCRLPHLGRVMGVMSNPFYQEMGFTKDEVGPVSKVYGVIIDHRRRGTRRPADPAPRRDAHAVSREGLPATNLLFVWLGRARARKRRRGDVHRFGGQPVRGSRHRPSWRTSPALWNQAYSARNYACHLGDAACCPQFIAGFSGEFVDAMAGRISSPARR